MSENYRKPIASLNKLPQFTTMNVIDGQAGLIMYTSLIFCSLTIDNILNIIVKGYNEIADTCYRKFIKSDYVCIQGYINNKMEIIIEDIEIF